TGLGARRTLPRVYIIASLGGGTGSGMFLDLAYVTRAVLKEQGCPAPDVVGLFLLPPVDRNAARTLALGNTYAALFALNYFTSANDFKARYQERKEVLRDGDRPFERCVFLEVPEGPGPGALSGGAGPAAELIYRDLFSPLDRPVDPRPTGAAPAARDLFT